MSSFSLRFHKITILSESRLHLNEDYQAQSQRLQYFASVLHNFFAYQQVSIEVGNFAKIILLCDVQKFYRSFTSSNSSICYLSQISVNKLNFKTDESK